MITLRDAEVAAGRAVKGSVSPAAGIDVAWLIWRLEVVSKAVMGEGATSIADYTVVEKCYLERGPSEVAFLFDIPAAGPVSYEGRLIRILWEIVVGSESGASANKVAEYARFKVVGALRNPT